MKSGQLYKVEDEDKLIDLHNLLVNFKYKDPDNRPDLNSSGQFDDFEEYKNSLKPDYSLDNPKSIYEAAWDSYFTYFSLHGILESKKGEKLFDTSKERLNMLIHIHNYLRRKPTGNDLKEAFNLTSEYDGICESVNEDIENIWR